MIYVWADGDVGYEPYEWKSDDYFTISGIATEDEAKALIRLHFGSGEQYESVFASVLDYLIPY
jgi:hypothetical protein